MGISANLSTEHALDSLRSHFTRSYSEDILERNDENLPFYCISGSCYCLSSLHNLMDKVIFHHHFEMNVLIY
jgi:hypothetical protein